VEVALVRFPLEPLLTGFLSQESLVPLGFLAVAAFLLMLSLRRRLRRPGWEAPEDTPVRRPPPVPQGEARIRRDMEDLLVELQDLSRKISAEIDTRFAKLEAVLRDADRRIAVLNRLARQVSAKGGGPVAEPESHEARHAVVYELADAGFSPVEIARDLGRTPGEVELILNLRKNAARRE